MQDFEFLNSDPHTPDKIVFSQTFCKPFFKVHLENHVSEYHSTVIFIDACSKHLLKGSIEVLLKDSEGKNLNNDPGRVLSMRLRGAEGECTIDVKQREGWVAECCYKLIELPLEDKVEILIYVRGRLLKNFPLTVTLLDHQDYQKYFQTKLKVGGLVNAKDQCGKWYESTVMEVKHGQVYIVSIHSYCDISSHSFY